MRRELFIIEAERNEVKEAINALSLHRVSSFAISNIHSVTSSTLRGVILSEVAVRGANGNAVEGSLPWNR
jgi:hypothetical protein